LALVHINKKYIKKNSIEKRDYQVNLANQAIQENCIVVLCTLIALQSDFFVFDLFTGF